MNKKVIFDKNIKSLDTVGHGSIRKSTLGVVAVLGLSFLGATAIQGPSVSADEVTASDASTTVVADTTTQTTDTTSVADTSSVADTTTYESTSAVAADDTTEQVATEVSEVTPVEDTVAQTDTTTQESTDTSVVTPQAEELDETATMVTDSSSQEVEVTSDELTSAVAAAKAAGVNVKQTATQNIGTAKTYEEAAALEKQAKDKEADEVSALTEATAEATAKATAIAAAESELEANKNTDGYLSQAYIQSLIFKSEPNAQHTVSKAQATWDDLLRVESGMRPETVDAMNNATNKQYIIATGESISVTYTNLENSSLDGTKIAKVVYTYTLNHSDYGNEVILGFNDDPTATLWYLNGDKDFNLNMDVKFYDETGNVIDPTGSLVSFASLNASNPNGGDWEGVSDFSGEMLPINGSSISVQSNGIARASVSNSWKRDGSAFDQPSWDVDGSPLEYYGAIVGRAKGSINFNIRSVGRGYVWFAFNSNIKAPVVTYSPISATYNTYSYTLEDQTSTTTSNEIGNVVVHYQDTQGNTIKADVQDTPDTVVSTTTTTTSSLNGDTTSTTLSGATYDTTDNKPTTITTEDGKTYKINLADTIGTEQGTLPAGTTQVTYIYDEVTGDVVVHYVNRDGQTIKTDVVDTPETSTGTAYDTTDNKPTTITLSNGQSYKIVPELTKGNETGEVTEGTTNVTYVYDEILGDVVVTYKDEDGNVIHEQVTDTPETSTGTNYDTTDNKIQTIVTEDGKTYQLTGIPNNEKGKVVEGRTVVPYVYTELKGDVIVHYVSEDGETIKGDVTDTPESSTGTKYDTTDNKPTTITTEDGRTFDIVPSSTKGNETGKVVVGTTEVTYVYKEVLGDVIVHYVDVNGNTIAADVTDTPETSTGTKYDTTDNKPASIAVTDEGGNVTIYNINTDKTEGNETGKVVRGTTEVTYVYDLAQATPAKTVKLEDGQDADGKTVLANSTLVYNVDIDNDNYKDVMSSLSSEQEQVGVTVIEDLDEAHVTANLDASRVVVKGSTTAVDGFYFTYYASRDEAPESVQAAYDEVVASGHTVNGGFVAVTSYNPAATKAEQSNQNLAYTRNILNKGTNLDVVLVTTVNANVDANEIDNTAHQVDFSGAKTTNTTVNNTPDINPEKDIVASVSDGLKNQNSLDGKMVNVGDTYDFELQGSTFSNLAEGLKTYGFTDTFSSLVQYDGVNSWFANVDITLADGTTITKGTDISEYVTQTITYNEDGTTSVDYEFDTDFLKSIDWTGNFQVVGYAQVKQVGEGTVENTFNEVVNGAVYSSNTVTVSTPTPEKPETPATPSTPTPTNATPVQAAALGTVELPKTGDSSNGMAILGAELLATVALAGVALKRKRAK